MIGRGAVAGRGGGDGGVVVGAGVVVVAGAGAGSVGQRKEARQLGRTEMKEEYCHGGGEAGVVRVQSALRGLKVNRLRDTQ